MWYVHLFWSLSKRRESNWATAILVTIVRLTNHILVQIWILWMIQKPTPLSSFICLIQKLYTWCHCFIKWREQDIRRWVMNTEQSGFAPRNGWTWRWLVINKDCVFVNNDSSTFHKIGSNCFVDYWQFHLRWYQLFCCLLAGFYTLKIGPGGGW